MIQLVMKYSGLGVSQDVDTSGRRLHDNSGEPEQTLLDLSSPPMGFVLIGMDAHLGEEVSPHGLQLSF